jgi:hypothetical protein
MQADRAAAYVLVQDIDASATQEWNGGEGFAPIGAEHPRFTGSFDGANYAITGLTVDRNVELNGLFGFVNSGVIESVGLLKANVTGGKNVGGLVGLMKGVQWYASPTPPDLSLR